MGGPAPGGGSTKGGMGSFGGDSGAPDGAIECLKSLNALLTIPLSDGFGGGEGPPGG